MRILITNDDGSGARASTVLRQIAEKLSSDVWIVAPEMNQSGASHSMTLHEPLRCEQIAERTFIIRGTPTDCVIMGVRHSCWTSRPISSCRASITASNLAEDVTYSGTIAAAIEGTLLGIRSIAMSQTGGSIGEGTIYWQTPLTHGPGIVQKLLDTGLADRHASSTSTFPPRPPAGGRPASR